MSQMSKEKEEREFYHVVIVGAGLSGLAFGIRLLQLKPGLHVLILEKRDKIGGLCQTVEIDGVKFEAGCNGFGSSIEGLMHKLEVKQVFRPMKTRFVFSDSDHRFDLPLSLRPFSIGSLLSLPYFLYQYAGDMLRFLYNLTMANSTKNLLHVTGSVKNQAFRNILNTLIAFPLIRPAEQISINLTKESLKDTHGYGDSRVPIGGTESLIGKMKERFHALGGSIYCKAEYVSHSLESTTKLKCIKIVKENKELSISTKALISSVNGWEQYQDQDPGNVQPSLTLASLLLVMDTKKDLKFPKDTHTVLFASKDIAKFFADFSAEPNSEDDKEQRLESLQNLTFHCFPTFNTTNAQNTSDYNPCGINVYFLSPRGKSTYSEDEKKRIILYLKDRLDNELPGFKDAIIKQQFISPAEYEEQLGIKSSPIPFMALSTELFTPSKYNQERDMYFIGNSVNLSYEKHAGGALQNAVTTAKQISDELDLST